MARPYVPWECALQVLGSNEVLFGCQVLSQKCIDLPRRAVWTRWLARDGVSSNPQLVGANLVPMKRRNMGE